jgi:transposase InsO family protein
MFLSSKYLTSLGNREVMRKLNKRQLRWIIREMKRGEFSVYHIARQQGITPRYVRILMKKYGKIPLYKIRVGISGRPPNPIDENERKMVLELYDKMPLGAVKMEKYHQILGIPRIPHNRIQRILTAAGLTTQSEKKIRRKKWVRYERYNSNSLWHTDYTETEQGEQIISYIDDASRFIVGYGKFPNATTDNALLVLRKAVKRYGLPKQIMTDHGTQFCVDKEHNYRFTATLKKMGIEHIMAAVKRPQSNGKIERWFGTTDKLYRHFESNLDKVVACYNNMPHLSIDTTPALAYEAKLHKN